METVGKFQFSRKDLIGHGAFAVVFKGRHKEKHDLEVAVKCINKKNLAKSQSLLGKEIKILKELKHENIVGLLDFQEISGCVYLVMEYCNGGDLAEYLHSKGSLSEDTIRSFLQQIAAAVNVLRSKGIIHRDLKPQNILLAYSAGRRANPNNICIKLADFGFARYLQGNTMAATLCGSPMYMAPEVIMSQNYGAKADLWSVGTIIFQCLTGKAPFQASSPQELRQFYERNRNLSPNIPRETSSHLRHLLLGLLQRNHRDRMDFDEFFHHPFLEASTAVRKSSPVPMPSYPSSGSGSSSSGSSTSHLTPTQSDADTPKPHPLPKATPPLASQLKDDDSSLETEDFVMVPAQFCSEIGDQGGQANQESEMQSGCSLLSPAACVGRTSPPSPSLRMSPSPARPVECCGSSYSQSVPVPVPTQIHNYQRMEQNLQGPSRTAMPTNHCCMGGFPGSGRTGGSPESGYGLSYRRLSTGGSRPYQPSPQVGTIPETPDQPEPQYSRTGQQDVFLHQQNRISPPFSDLGAMETNLAPKYTVHRHSPDNIVHRWELGRRASCPQTLSPVLEPAQGPPLGAPLGRTRTMPDLQEHCVAPHNLLERRRSSVKRSMSAGRLSDMLLKAVFGAQLDRGSGDGLNTERPMDTTVPSGGMGCLEKGSAPVLFTLGSPPHGHTRPLNAKHRRYSVGSSSPDSPVWICGHFHKTCHSPDDQHYGYVDAMAANLPGGVAFIPPELPEETLMEQGHTDMLAQLRFTLAFAHCVMEVAASKDSGIERNEAPDASFLEQSLVADQISQLSREWSSAEQLVLYMKCAELLSTALHTAMEAIKQEKFYPSASVKQVVRKLNQLYKECVTSCRSLTARLQLFFSTKQKLMDRFHNITAEKIIYSHTVQMVQAAALDEMFHHGEASAQRYQKALLLMEGLSLIITESADLNNINKCKQCIERRLFSLQPGLCA
ncbi:serine/threonine-protein kinase ULK1a [Pygocentrus nattereri]|uniref:non-specific serine/threonine protein kinase n=1 Tax=Pygocentrus nattereri TaxID=42514 RepID=A0A3B4CAC1_PYGNA|nr:serine/threonine-protein kinase ULK1a [Pygocentrus nattereri]